MNRLFLAVIIPLTISCDKSVESTIEVKTQSQYEIRDSLLLSTIVTYIEEVGLEKNSEYLMLYMSGTDKYYLSKYNSELTMADKNYIGYSKVNGVFVLFVSEGIERMENLALRNEMVEVINNELTNLESGFEGDLTHPPFWEITYCKGSLSVLKDTQDKNPYRVREVPCNYKIYRDSVNYYKLYLQMEE